jgi:hypothetical protein
MLWCTIKIWLQSQITGIKNRTQLGNYRPLICVYNINILLWVNITLNFCKSSDSLIKDTTPEHTHSLSHNICFSSMLWCTIKIWLQSQITGIKNRTQLVAKMKEIWTSLPQHYRLSLYASIPKRLCQVIRSKGHATKY